MMKYILELLAFLAIISIAIGANGNGGNPNGLDGKLTEIDNTDAKCDGYIKEVALTLTNWTKNMLIDETKVDKSRYCTKAIKDQIAMEVSASAFYLSLGAHFSLDTVNRPGFANFFFEAAKEEREHASHLIDYLRMRGEDKLDINMNIKIITEQLSGKAALHEALKKELIVTDSIKNVIRKCEKPTNDFHVVDYLTGVYLEEQYKGQRDLAGKLATLTKMTNNNKDLGEFMFDKTLL